MSTSEGIPSIPLPRCPHCCAELDGVGCFNWAHPSGAIICVYCPNLECRKVLTMNIVLVAPEQSRVRVPN